MSKDICERNTQKVLHKFFIEQVRVCVSVSLDQMIVFK